MALKDSQGLREKLGERDKSASGIYFFFLSLLVSGGQGLEGQPRAKGEFRGEGQVNFRYYLWTL